MKAWGEEGNVFAPFPEGGEGKADGAEAGADEVVTKAAESANQRYKRADDGCRILLNLSSRGSSAEGFLGIVSLHVVGDIHANADHTLGRIAQHHTACINQAD
jgi:hypothetical protein